MTKFAVLFFAAVAFQATFAVPSVPHHSQEQRNHEVQDLLSQVQSVSSDASSAIQNAQDIQDRHAIYSQANEFGHYVHEVVYHLYQVIQHNQAGQGQEVLQQVAQSLSDVVHSVQQAVHHEPIQLRAELKSQVQVVAAQAQSLARVAQQPQESDNVNDDLEHVLDDLLASVQHLQYRNRLQGRSQQQIKSQIQAIVTEVSDVIQNVNSHDEQTVEELSHHAHHLAHHIGDIVHRLQREVDNYDGEVHNVIQQVISKLSEVRAALDHVANSEEGNAQARVSELKNQLKTNVHNVAVQVERLVQVHFDSLDQHELQHFRNLVHSVLADALVAAKQLQRHVEASIESHREN